jgi:hypothetical protein
MLLRLGGELGLDENTSAAVVGYELNGNALAKATLCLLRAEVIRLCHSLIQAARETSSPVGDSTRIA